MAFPFYTAMTIESKAFANNGLIPDKFKNVNPELGINKVPKNARSLALVIENTNYYEGGFVNWIVWNIPPSGSIRENSIPGVQGRNSNNKNDFAGFYHNPNHYFLFKVYALNAILDIPSTSGRNDLIKAMHPHIIGSGILVGRFYEMVQLEGKMNNHPHLLAS